MLSVKQTARIISAYAGDTSGVCSALYELGGMTVMHDASGCNSTYNTHDEPRWYDMDSLVFISALTEMEALMGDDAKLVGDVVKTASELSPRFIALAGSPIPMLTGVDFSALAMEVEEKTGIPSFGFPTDGMHSYISGASMAFAGIARRLCLPPKKREKGLTFNLLGVTPLDFSVNGTDAAMVSVLEKAGLKKGAVWAMGSTYEEIVSSGEADVNLVVSACGLEAARVLRERFGTPYVVGTPWGEKFTDRIVGALKKAAGTGKCQIVCDASGEDAQTVIIGESVTALSLSCALREETGRGALVLCPVDSDPELLSHGFISAWDEDDLIPYLEKARRIIADPLYQPICPKEAAFIPLPHEAFSGRIYRREIPELVTGLKGFIEKYGLKAL